MLYVTNADEYHIYLDSLCKLSLTRQMMIIFIIAATAAKWLQLCPTLRPQRRQPSRLPHPWASPGKNTGVGCHFLLQCIKVKS